MATGPGRASGPPGGEEAAGDRLASGPAAATADRSASIARALALGHVVLLVVARTLWEADDVNNWDLIPFLNAHAESLAALLRRSEVHFAHPFAMPIYIVGGESVPSAILFKVFERLSLYWANPLVTLTHAAVFLFLVDRLFSRVLGDGWMRTWAWLLLGMSPVILTFASTSAFNLLGYCVLVLGLVGVEDFARGRFVRGTALLSLAFLAIAQGYALALFLPYYAVAWAVFRAVTLRDPRVLRSLLAVAALALVVQLASGDAYLAKISPVDPHGYGNLLGEGGALASRALLFLRASLGPVEEGPSGGFGPWMLWISGLVLAEWGAASARGARSAPSLGSAVTIAAGLGLLAFAYGPAFLSPVVKSQRSVPGDLLLALLIALFAAELVNRGRLERRRVTVLLAAMALVADARYLGTVLAVDHSVNHYPTFDFDRSDSVVRHDLQRVLGAMKHQVEELGAALVVVYPRSHAFENNTDPALFHARFLRHFGEYRDRDDVFFPCRFCDPRYGCPFPASVGAMCASMCCYESPLAMVRRARQGGRRVFVWWLAETQQDVWSLSPETLLPPEEGALVALPTPAAKWECYEVTGGRP